MNQWDLRAGTKGGLIYSDMAVVGEITSRNETRQVDRDFMRKGLAFWWEVLNPGVPPTPTLGYTAESYVEACLCECGYAFLLHGRF